MDRIANRQLWFISYTTLKLFGSEGSHSNLSFLKVWRKENRGGDAPVSKK